MNPSKCCVRCLAALAVLATFMGVGLNAQIVPTNDPPVYGPYNATIEQGGDGLRKKMMEKDTVLRADSPWTMYAWVNFDAPVTQPELVVGIGVKVCWRLGARPRRCKSHLQCHCRRRRGRHSRASISAAK